MEVGRGSGEGGWKDGLGGVDRLIYDLATCLTRRSESAIVVLLVRSIGVFTLTVWSGQTKCVCLACFGKDFCN